MIDREAVVGAYVEAQRSQIEASEAVKRAMQMLAAAQTVKRQADLAVDALRTILVAEEARVDPRYDRGEGVCPDWEDPVAWREDREG